MSNLYPHLNNNNNNPSQSENKLPGSFDDYESVDGFSIGYNNKEGYESDDVSSMHMSEMGGVSVNAARPDTAVVTTTNGDGDEMAQFLPASMAASLALQSSNDIVVAADNAAPPLTAAAPPTAIALTTTTTATCPNSPQRSTSSNTFAIENVDDSGYYHVGDYNLGIDTTDVSAILGVASEDVLDEESLLFGAGAGTTDTADAAGVRGSTAGVRGTDTSLSLPRVSAGVPYDEVKKNASEKKQFGPLGDELSYTGSKNHESNPVYIKNDNYSNNNQDSFYDSEDEEEEYDGILPNWIAFSGQRAKCVFVTSTALILGSFVLAIVAIGISYGAVGSNMSNDNNNGGSMEAVSVESGPAGDTDVTVGNNGNIMDDINTLVPTEYPTFSPMSNAPVLSTTGEEEGNSPTFSPTISRTTTEDVSTQSSPPTESPSNPVPMEPAVVVTLAIIDEPTTSSPAPTLQLTSKPSFRPSNSLTTSPTTFTASPTKSASPTANPSYPPTTTLHPSLLPSIVPTAIPSVAITTSSKPSWGFGEEALEDGDATFYLMADAGSNWQFWTEKMKELSTWKDQKFVVHLGSATRAVDNCEETAYYRTQLSLSVSPIPVYSIPGNNDYPECANPTKGWEYYQKHMMNLDTKHWNITDDSDSDSNAYQVKRQAERNENFSFLYKRVLFVGLNMVTNDASENTTLARLEDNVEWIFDNANAYGENINAIFIMGYGRLLATENLPFYYAMVAKAKSEEWSDKLIVYARRSAETDVDENVGGASNFMELRVGNEWPILDVKVRTKGKDGPTLDFRDVYDDGKEGV